MKTALPIRLLLCAPLLLSSCGEAPEETPTPTPPAATTPAAGDPQPARGTDVVIDPFTGQAQQVTGRITQLPSDEFFVQNNYPGSSVFDVKSSFGIPTVLLTTDDTYEEVDAFYREKFKGPDGETQGRPGRYYIGDPNTGHQVVKFDKQRSGGCIIELSM